MENSVLTGRVHSFQSMGAVDGPGLRYVVFFQGCPLRCAYCHNPDTWAFDGGQETTVEDVLQKVRRCAPYIKKTGGVTLTGGEPLSQSDFAAALLTTLKAFTPRWTPPARPALKAPQRCWNTPTWCWLI